MRGVIGDARDHREPGRSAHDALVGNGLEKGLVGNTDKEADAPIDSACTDEEHAEMAAKAAAEAPAGTIRFINE